MSTWSLEMFYDLAEEVFILNFSIWKPESENRSKPQSILILVRAILYKFFEALRKVGNEDPLCFRILADFNEYRSKHQNSKWKRVLRPRFEIRNDLGFVIRPIEKFLHFAEKKFSSVKIMLNLRMSQIFFCCFLKHTLAKQKKMTSKKMTISHQHTNHTPKISIYLDTSKVTFLKNHPYQPYCAILPYSP